MLESDLLTELSAELTMPELQPDEITAPMLAERTSLSENTCRDQLEKFCKAGRLTWHWVKIGCSRAKAYSRTKQDNDGDSRKTY
ncbi:MAG: hypothetical protein VB108_01090 [Anaerolineaceae bacterium]|nr:hypothetical protein [Anaerolineaceae bacterium]